MGRDDTYRMIYRVKMCTYAYMYTYIYISSIHIGDDAYAYGTAESDIGWYQLGEGFFFKQ